MPWRYHAPALRTGKQLGPPFVVRLERFALAAALGNPRGTVLALSVHAGTEAALGVRLGGIGAAGHRSGSEAPPGARGGSVGTAGVRTGTVVES
jgi:hypothetical protein